MKITKMAAKTPVTPTTIGTTPPAADFPAQLLSIPFYFTSPLNTLLESLHDPDCNQVTIHDIMEAYCCFSDRIRTTAKSFVHTERIYAALKILEEHSVELVQVLRRDLRRALSDPPLHSQHSFNLYPHNISHGFSDDDAQHILDSAKLAQHALCLISDICIFRPLYSLFSASAFQTILDDVLAFTVAPELSMLNGSKICTFIVWILQVQQLPAEILLSRKDDILLTLTKAVRGRFGPQAVMDGLKATHALLLQLGASILPSLANLLPFVLDCIVDGSPEVRLQSAYALGGLAYAVTLTNRTPELCRSVHHVVQTFINNHQKKRKYMQQGISLLKIVEDAVTIIRPTNSGQTPCWALTVISSIIVLLDCTLFFHPHCVKLCFSVLSQAAHHKRSAVRALHCHIWKLLIWAYLRIPSSVENDKVRKIDVSDIKKRAFKVVAQETKDDIGVAFVASLLREGRTLKVTDLLAEDIENALRIARDMLRSSDSNTRRNGVSLFGRLFKSNEEDATSEQPKDQLLCQSLFDGSLLNVDINTLGGVVSSFRTFVPESVRQLTNGEIYDNWKSVVSVWVAAAQVSLREPESDLSNFALSSWISLLEIFVQRCDSLTPTTSPSGLSSSIAMIAGQLLDASDSPDVQIRHLQFVKKVWTSTKSVLYDTWLPSNAEIILAAILKRNFILSDDGVRKAWSELCADLIAVGVPTLLHVVYFQSERKEQVEVLKQLWAVLVRTWHTIDHDIAWDDLVTLLVVPFKAWKLSTQEFDQWESLLRSAVNLAEGSSAPHNAVTRLFCERLGNDSIEAFKASPQALCSILRKFNISSSTGPEHKVFEMVDEVLSTFYPPRPESLATCIDLLCIMGELLATCPEEMLFELIKVTQRSLSCWIRDEGGVLLDTEQNIVVDAVYCNTLNRLCHHELTYDMLKAITAFLVSVFKAKYIPIPALGPAAFENFWRTTFHDREDLELHCPDEIKACIAGLSLAWGRSIAGSLAVGTDSQKSVSFVPSSQSTPWNRRSSARAFVPISSPCDVFSTPRRYLSSPSSLPEDAFVTDLIDNVESQETPTSHSREDSGRATPTNILILGRLASKSDNTTNLTPRHNARGDNGGIFKSRKRPFSSEGSHKRRRFYTPSPQTTLPVTRKAYSEPAIEPPSSLPIINHSISQPNPSRKRKLFDSNLIDLPHIRNTRSRHYFDSFPTTPERPIGSTLSQIGPSCLNLVDETECSGRQQYRRASAPEETEHAAINDWRESLDSHLPCTGPHHSETQYRSQSLPVTTETGAVGLRRSQLAAKRLEDLQHALTVVAETDGISQVSVQDLLQATRLVNQLGMVFGEHVSRKLTENKRARQDDE
ncbi:hypothetical protein AX15_004051 [Amanita polypyramis BW_CC]|nr:hypothetical protein AX15_004051 [Amanita polypyramis BW_CC]